MNGILDIICSIVIGGILALMLVSFNGNLEQQAGAQTIKVMAQSNLTTVTNIVDYDMRKVGYGLTRTDSAVLYADSIKLKFRADIDNNGTMDTLTYQFDPAGVSGQTNTNTHILKRTRSSVTLPMNIGITRMRFYYFDSSGNPLTQSPVPNPSKIKTIKVSLNLESIVPSILPNETYLKSTAGVSWDRTFRPRNLW